MADERYPGLEEVIDLGDVIHFSFTDEEAARHFRAAAQLLGAAVVDNALFDNAATADDGFYYVTVMGEEAER